MILFLLRTRDADDRRTVVTFAKGREQAKNAARSILGGDPDQYVVSPLTKPDDSVYFTGQMGLEPIQSGVPGAHKTLQPPTTYA